MSHKQTTRPLRRQPKTVKPKHELQTSERIVHSSIALSNRHGIRNVSNAMIAAHLKISPGNLTYHFKRKRDLRLASLDVLQTRLQTALAKPVDVASAQAAGEHLVRLFRTFWEFRFFFNELTHLLSEDAEIRKQFGIVKASALDSIERDITFLQTKGYFASPRSPNSFGLLAENMWALLLHWLRMQQIESPFAVMPKNKALYDCSLRLWSILEPWMETSFANELLLVFEKLFGIKGKSRLPDSLSTN